MRVTSHHSMLRLAAAVSGVLCFAASQANAAPITWDASATTVDTTNPSQVSTAGTFYDSFAFATSAQSTVNGVTFNPMTTSLSAPSTVHFSNSKILAYITNGNAPYAKNIETGTGSYASLLNDSALWTYSYGSQEYIKILGLNPGDEYLVQLWNAPWTADESTEYSIGSAFLSDDSPLVYSEPGSQGSSQFIDGTFTADSTGVETIFMTSGYNQYEELAAGQVRDITATPEPATFGVFIACSAALLARPRRRAASM